MQSVLDDRLTVIVYNAGFRVRGIPAVTPALVYQPHANPALRAHAMAQAHRGGPDGEVQQ